MLAGIATFSYSISNRPNVYTRISYFYEYIKDVAVDLINYTKRHTKSPSGDVSGRFSPIAKQECSMSKSKRFTRNMGKMFKKSTYRSKK